MLLIYVFVQPHLNAYQARWLDCLAELNLKVHYVPGVVSARLRLAWARGPAHVAHARGQYRHLSAVHTASALVSGLLLTWYSEFS